MHGKIRHEHARRDEVRFVFAVEGAPESRACQLDHVKARFAERNADDLELFTCARQGQLESRCCFVRVDRAHLAFAHVALERFLRASYMTLLFECAEATQDRAFLRKAHRTTRDRLRVGRTHCDRLARERRFDVAHGHRQQWLGVQLEDAEASRKFDEGRELVRRRLDRKGRLVLRFTSRIVTERTWQLEREARFLRKRPFEVDRLNRARLLCYHRLIALTIFRLQP